MNLMRLVLPKGTCEIVFTFPRNRINFPLIVSVAISVPDNFFYRHISQMKVEINHKEVLLPEGCDTLTALLQSQGISEKGHAIAVNNRVVPRAQWAEYTIADGMKITVIKAVCGG